MDKTWIISTMSMDGNYDGILDPTTFKTETKLFHDFEEAVDNFRSILTEYVDTDADFNSFNRQCSVANNLDCGIAEEEDEEYAKMLQSMLATLLCGKDNNLTENTPFCYYSDDGSEVKCDYSDEGEAIISIEGGGPILMANCVTMKNSTSNYYFRMENWFGEDHIFCSIEMTSVC